MEWPTVNLSEEEYDNDYNDYDLVATLTRTMITKEIYARAAMGCVSDVTVDHRATGLQEKVDTFLEKLTQATDIENNQKWATYGYRNIAREFTELMAFSSTIVATQMKKNHHHGRGSSSSSRILEICQGGLDAVHDLMKYRVPSDSDSSSSSSSSNTTILAARDAYVLCQSLSPKLDTQHIMGTRAPDIDYKFGLLAREELEGSTNKQSCDIINDTNSLLFGLEACDYVTKLRKDGQIETSASSLAKYTFTANSDNLIAKLSQKIFVVLGCDHPMAPTKSLLRIPGVTVIGIPTSWKGLDHIIQYVQFNSPDDTTFTYPTGGGRNNGSSGGTNDGNYIISHGPHIAQWILQSTTNDSSSASRNNDYELVIVPMAAPNSHRESAVRYAAASDLIIQRVLRARSDTTKISLWMYQSPETCMVVPPACTTKSQELLNKRPSYEPWIHTLSMKTILTPTGEEDPALLFDDRYESTTTTTTTNNNGTTAIDDVENNIGGCEKKIHNQNNTNINHEYAIVNGIIATPGGAHHILAETIRMWRCLITNLSSTDAYDNDDDDDYDDDDDDDIGAKRINTPTGCDNNNEVHVFAPYIPLLKTNGGDDDVSAIDTDNILLTESNLLKIFDIGAASSLMTSIALALIVDPIVNRPMPTMDDDETTPFALFWEGSFHGGIWNCPYTLDSVSGVSGYVLGKVYNYYGTYVTTAAAQSFISSSTSASAIVEAGKNNGDVNNDNNNSKERRNYSSDSSPSIIDAVPSTLGEPMPDLVRARLEILS